MRSATNLRDVVIVGAGVTGTSTFIKLIEEWILDGKKGSITIVEKRASLGPGLPFNTNQPKTLRINDPFNASDLSLHHEYRFLKWLKLENAKGNPDVIALGVGKSTLENRYPPRAIFGKYCKWAFKKAMIRGIQHGISVDIQSSTQVLDTEKSRDHWTLVLSNNLTLKSKNLVLATGHMPSEHYVALEGKPGFYATPWEDLSKIPNDETVAVFGSGLTAIDTAKKLCAQGHQGKIYFISKSAALPSVKPPLHNQKVILQFLNRENVDKPGLTLKVYLDLFQRELNLHVTPSVDFTQKLTTHLNPKAWLEKNIALVEKGVVRTWQLLLDEIYFNSLPFAWKHLSDADKTNLMKHYFGPYLKWAAGTPLANAKELMEMLNRKQLELIQGLPEVKEMEEGFQLNFYDSNRVMNVKYIINGTGMGHNIDRNPLLKKMHSRKLLKKASQGGIEVDPQTYQVYSVNKNLSPYTNLYSAGPAIFGSNPAVYAIEASALAGEEIGGKVGSKDIVSKCSLFRLNGKLISNDTTNLSTGVVTRTKLV